MTPDQLANLSAQDLMAWAVDTLGDRFAIVTAFQPEGMVLVDMAARHAAGRLGSRIITVDTGRLPQETYDMMDTVRARYGVPVEVLSPDPGELERMVGRHGLNLFRGDPSLRKLCCHIRKVRPLDLRLKGTVDAWATGLRREQSAERSGVGKVDRPDGDAAGGRLKLNPLADWTHQQVAAYIAEFDVPVHPLLGQGYRTVGCAPCSRAVAEGEDERAGRWWWEQEGSEKECGIHVTPSGQFKRTLDVLLEEILH